MKGHDYYLEKADLALADLTAEGGELVPDQAQRFIRLMIKQAKIVRMSNVPTMKRAKQHIETIRFSNQVLQAATEATALPTSKRVRPDMTKVTLDVKEVIGETRHTYTAVEDNIEQGTLRTTVMQEFTRAAGRDVEKLVLRGDTGSADDYLALIDGMIAAATTNTSAKSPKGKLVHNDFVDILRTMPEEFREDEDQLKFITSVGATDDYRASLAARATSVGDEMLASQRVLRPLDIELIKVPLMPKDLGAGTDETAVLLYHPMNVNVGFYRGITIETDKDIKARVYIVVMTMRLDFKYTHEPAVVKGTGVLS